VNPGQDPNYGRTEELNMPPGTYEVSAERIFARSPTAGVRPAAMRRAQRPGWGAWKRSAPKPPLRDARAATTLALIGGGRLMRGATARLLAAQADLQIQGTFESVVHFLASGLDEPEVLLLDCDGDCGSWRSSVSVLRRSHASAKIVMFCQEVSQETIGCAMEHRVSGMLLKSYSAEDIGQAITYMASGHTIMPAGWQREATPARRGLPAVSPRLRQILTLIAQGHSNEEIAAELGLSPNTIKFHVRALYARLGVHNRVEAALLYAQMMRGAS
jgi:two-component system, NarL family, nitrate/nitrite response regulator NarL